MTLKTISFVLLLTLPLVASAQGKAKASEYSCQHAAENIERYKELRRKGGTASEMEHWKRMLRENQERYKLGDCKRFKKKRIERKGASK